MYLKYHIKESVGGFQFDGFEFVTLHELVKYYQGHPVKHSSDEEHSSDTKLTVPLINCE